MKRTSIAESTLKKQIEYVYAQIASVDKHIEAFNMQRATYVTMLTNLESEQQRLKDARVAASEQNTRP